jgi:hypothetical protein
VQLNETFTVEDGYLVRRVVPVRGEPYQHRCPAAAFEAVAFAAREAEGGFTLTDLVRVTGMPSTQVAVALAFLKERGIVVPTGGKRHQANGQAVHLDAMTEYHALREKGPGA